LRFRIGKQEALSPAQARDEAILLSARVIAGEDVQKEKKRERQAARFAKSRTLDGFLRNKYEPWVCSQRKTGTATIQRIRSNFAHLMDRSLNEISVWAIETWRSQQLKSGKAGTTINRDVIALKACLSKAVEWEVLDAHPLRKLRPIKTDKLPCVRYLTKGEEDALRNALRRRDDRIRNKRRNGNGWRRMRHVAELPDLADQHYADHLRPMVLLTLNTGLRRGEIFCLQWADVDLSRNIMTIRGGTAKSGTTRHIPLNPEVALTLQRWKSSTTYSDWVFPAKDGGRLTSIRTSWHTVLRDAKINDFRWHDLRHHFASRLVMTGVDLNTVRELLGHSDLSMTLRYAHLSPEHKAEAVARLCETSNQVERRSEKEAAFR
jgi:integrase